jgi:hypothetical protein
MGSQDPVIDSGSLDPSGSGSPDAPAAVAPGMPPAAQPGFDWKSGLPADLANSPTYKMYDNSKEGLAKAVTSHLELEKLLGTEKVPIPKGPDDKEGWNRYAKAMGIPDKADAYGLADPDIPESMKGVTFNKQKFAEVVHAHKLTPGQAKGLWEAYTNMAKEAYGNAMKSHQETMTKTVNQMRSEWGDAYDSNVELGQMVINKFASEQDSQDFITATLAKDPRGIKFLAKIGSQFAENKIGDFSYSRFSLSPEQAQTEIDKILADPKHPYNSDKATEAERTRAIDYVNSLYVAKSKANG